MSLLSDRIRSLRISQGITQKDVAEKIGVAESSYAMYESGRREPDVEKIKRLARAFNVSGDYIIGLDEDNAYETIGLLVSLYLSADERAKGDVILLLRSHQLQDEKHADQSIMETARHMIEKAKEQNGMKGTLPRAK